jgi:hypothetical protein
MGFRFWLCFFCFSNLIARRAVDVGLWSEWIAVLLFSGLNLGCVFIYSFSHGDTGLAVNLTNHFHEAQKPGFY